MELLQKKYLNPDEKKGNDRSHVGHVLKEVGKFVVKKTQSQIREEVKHDKELEKLIEAQIGIPVDIKEQVP